MIQPLDAQQYAHLGYNHLINILGTCMQIQRYVVRRSVALKGRSFMGDPLLLHAHYSIPGEQVGLLRIFFRLHLAASTQATHRWCVVHFVCDRLIPVELSPCRPCGLIS